MTPRIVLLVTSLCAAACGSAPVGVWRSQGGLSRDGASTLGAELTLSETGAATIALDRVGSGACRERVDARLSGTWELDARGRVALALRCGPVVVCAAASVDPCRLLWPLGPYGVSDRYLRSDTTIVWVRRS